MLHFALGLNSICESKCILSVLIILFVIPLSPYSHPALSAPSVHQEANLQGQIWLPSPPNSWLWVGFNQWEALGKRSECKRREVSQYLFLIPLLQPLSSLSVSSPLYQWLHSSASTASYHIALLQQCQLSSGFNNTVSLLFSFWPRGGGDSFPVMRVSDSHYPFSVSLTLLKPL